MAIKYGPQEEARGSYEWRFVADYLCMLLDGCCCVGDDAVFQKRFLALIELAEERTKLPHVELLEDQYIVQVGRNLAASDYEVDLVVGKEDGELKAV